MFGRNESESFGFQSRFRRVSPTWIDKAGPTNRNSSTGGTPETGQPVELPLRWGLIPHFCETRPDFAPIHARAETVVEKEWFRGGARRRRCIVPMNSFFQKDTGGKRYAAGLSVFAGIWKNWCDPLTGKWERTFAVAPCRPTNWSRRSMIACSRYRRTIGLRAG